jgi:hypothetical protein
MTIIDAKSKFAKLIADQIGFVPQDIACGWLLAHDRELKSLWGRDPLCDVSAKEILIDNIAKLFLNTLCIAFQYNVDLLVHYKESEISTDITEAIQKSQPIALTAGDYSDYQSNFNGIRDVFEVMAYYHGWRYNLPESEIQSGIGNPILKVHRLVYGICKANNVDLESEVERIVADAKRISLGGPKRYDPSHSPILDAFITTKNQSVCTYARTSFFWGAEPYSGSGDSESPDFDNYLSKCLPVIARLSRCSRHEDVNCFLMMLPTEFGNTVHALSQTVGRVLRHLWLYDPSGAHPDERPASNQRWRFEFCESQYFVQAFGPAYELDKNHTRMPRPTNSDKTFINFVTEDSFKRHAGKKGTKQRETYDNQTRELAKKRGAQYNFDHPEHLRFVLPHRHDEMPVDWTANH